MAGEATQDAKEAVVDATNAVTAAASTAASQVKEASKDSSIARGAVVAGQTVCSLSQK